MSKQPWGSHLSLLSRGKLRLQGTQKLDLMDACSRRQVGQHSCPPRNQVLSREKSDCIKCTPVGRREGIGRQMVESTWNDKCLFLIGIDRNNLALGKQTGLPWAGGWLLLREHVVVATSALASASRSDKWVPMLDVFGGDWSQYWVIISGPCV